MLAAHAIPARPRPDRALQGVPAPQAQDAGVRGARGRPLPHAPHPHARDDADLAHRRPRAAAQRGPRGGDRARPRPRPPAVRPHRRGRARPLRARALRARLPPQRALAAGRGRARARSTSPTRCATGSCATRAGRASPRRSRARSCAWSTASPTSTTTSTTPCGPACYSSPTCRRRTIAVLGDTGSRRIDRLVHDLVEHSERAGDIVQGEEVGGRDDAAARLHVRDTSTWGRPRAREHAKIERVMRGAVRMVLRPPGGAGGGRAGRDPVRPRDRLPRRHDRPLRHPRVDRARGAPGPARVVGLLERCTEGRPPISVERCGEPTGAEHTASTTLPRA